jgi:hypothetical protein
MVDGKKYNVGLWDTAGQEDYDRLRPLSYPDSDVVLVAFAVNCRDSFANVEEKWIPELHHYIPGCPVVLVGCKADLRNETGDGGKNWRGEPFVTFTEATALASRLGLQGYVETSALAQTNVAGCFDHAIRTSVQKTAAKKRQWIKAGRPKQQHPGGMTRARPTAPVMPETGRAPYINPENATYSRDMAALLLGATPTTPALAATSSAAVYAGPDLLLQLGGDEGDLYAHKLVLASVSPEMERFVRAVDAGKDAVDQVPFALVPEVSAAAGSNPTVQTLQLLSADQPPAYSTAAPPPYNPHAVDKAGVFPAPPPSAPPKTQSSPASTTRWPVLSPRAVRIVIEWLYTGSADRLPGAIARQQQQPFVGTADQQQWLQETTAAAAAFKCEELAQYIANIKAGEGWLNPSFGTFLSDRTGNRAHQLFAGRDWLADVCVQPAAAVPPSSHAQCALPAHASLLAARCPLFKKLLLAQGNTLRTNQTTICCRYDHHTHLPPHPVLVVPPTPPAVLTVILEFIYRDHVEFGVIDHLGGEGGQFTAVELMLHAHHFGLPRLVSLCELQITKVVDVQCRDAIARSDCDPVGLLNLAASVGAKQLEAWCLHFIASNYGPVSQMKQWSDLSARHRRHCDQHQWPPPHYLQATVKYESAIKKWDQEAAQLKHKSKYKSRFCRGEGVGGTGAPANEAATEKLKGCSIM